LDGGATWHPARGLTRLRGGFLSRLELAYAPGSPDTVYANVALDGGTIWRSTDGGASYTLRTQTGVSGADWYHDCLWVDPTDAQVLVAGGQQVYRSQDGGATLERIGAGYLLTQQPHPDVHAIVADPAYDGAGNRRVYVATDGGVHRTDDILAASIT